MSCNHSIFPPEKKKDDNDQDPEKKMKITILTIVPEMFAGLKEDILVKRACEKGLLELEIIDIRDYSGGSFRHTDESPYGGGAGMVMRCEPVIRAYRDVRSENSRFIILSPAGKPYTQKKAREFASEEHLILLCGHYEGMDERITDYADDMISAGDYILSGGEIPAMMVTDSVARLLSGNIRRESTEEESFENGLLEYPQYTRPYDFEGKTVPDVLLSGNHEAVRRWRLKESLRTTLHQRPDLLEHREMNEEEKELLSQILSEEAVQ